MVIVTCAPNRLTFDCADIINVPSKIRPCIIMVGNPTPVRGILEKILPEVLQNLPKAAGRGQILEGRGQDFFQQF